MTEASRKDEVSYIIDIVIVLKLLLEEAQIIAGISQGTGNSDTANATGQQLARAIFGSRYHRPDHESRIDPTSQQKRKLNKSAPIDDHENQLYLYSIYLLYSVYALVKITLD